MYVLEFESENKLERIEACAFQCSGIQMIRIPSSVEFIGSHIYYLENLLVACSVTSLKRDRDMVKFLVG
jgi:galactokinase